jgi:hypothetical protein
VNLDRWTGQLALLAASFVVVTAIALLLGAANLGTAATFGQLAFAGAFMYLIAKR